VLPIEVPGLGTGAAASIVGSIDDHANDHLLILLPTIPLGYNRRMSSQIAILDSPDRLILSEEAQAALGLRAGSRVSVTIEEGRVILQALEEDDLNQLAGSLSSTPGMAEELRQDRRREPW
jgi:hypothetical protein